MFTMINKKNKRESTTLTSYQCRKYDNVHNMFYGNNNIAYL